MEALERRIGLRRNATRAPTQAPEWRGRLRPPRISNKTAGSITYCGRKMVLTMGATFDIEDIKSANELMQRKKGHDDEPNE